MATPEHARTEDDIPGAADEHASHTADADADADADVAAPAASTTTTDSVPGASPPARGTGDRWPHRTPVIATLAAVLALGIAFAAGYGVGHERTDGRPSGAHEQRFEDGRHGDMGGRGPQGGDRYRGGR